VSHNTAQSRALIKESAMSIHRISAVVITIVAAAVLTATPAAARVPPDPGDPYGTNSPCPMTAAHQIASASAADPIYRCPHTLTLAERRLIHADLIQALRDGQ
jgi:hypothetical protein